ncbi:MAG: RNA-protein complex protein Nop10 [Aeropyrum sp.]|nr:RNA-protein complex protein Nop10 [Aeropyrum sp.]MCE4616137.1 RNA-protein complex protein Nop10 [Aeropyrum sp.]
MQWILRRCSACGRYTLRKDRCPSCGGKLVVPHPPRFSPDNRYLRYRYELKKKLGMIPS